MTVEQMRCLKEGDTVVKVRKYYQNYDCTKVPCEPKVLTVAARCLGELYFNETVKKSYVKEGKRYVSAHGCDPELVVEDYETLEDYLAGSYKRGVILDEKKWANMEEFLKFKAENDHRLAREAENKRVAEEDALLKKRKPRTKKKPTA